MRASDWTEAYMSVIYRAKLFSNALDEWRGNKEFTRELAKERRQLEIALAIYRVERRKNVLRRRS